MPTEVLQAPRRRPPTVARASTLQTKAEAQLAGNALLPDLVPILQLQEHQPPPRPQRKQKKMLKVRIRERRSPPRRHASTKEELVFQQEIASTEAENWGRIPRLRPNSTHRSNLCVRRKLTLAICLL